MAFSLEFFPPLNSFRIKNDHQKIYVRSQRVVEVLELSSVYCSAWVWINLEGPPRPLTFSVRAVILLVLFCEHHDVSVWISSLRTFAASSIRERS